MKNGDAGDGDPTTVIAQTRGLGTLSLRDIWLYRELLYFLVWRSVKIRYKQTIIGALWAILKPFAAMIVFTLFFHRTLGIEPDGDLPYALWSYAGLLPWAFFSQAVVRCGDSLVGNRNLLTKVYFPRLVIPVSAALGGLVDLAAAFAVYVGMMFYYSITPGWRLLILPALLLLAIGTALAVGLWFAALNVHFRDAQYILPFLVQIWLFISPVVYPSSRILEKFGEGYGMLYGLNPMVGVIEGFRWCLLGTGPGYGPMFWASVGVTVVLLFTGVLFFSRMERTFADVV